jgi:hypothetical protein
MPIVYGLEEAYAGRVNVITYYWDNPEQRDLIKSYGMTDRAQYVLLDPDGEVIQRWYGGLNEPSVRRVFDNFLENFGIE